MLQSTLGQLRLNNIATLDALTTHFTRLIDLTSADNDFVTSLAQTLAPCVLRPRLVNSLTMEERHPYRLVRDLFEHKEAIFGELKRQASAASGSSAQAARARAVSSVDEGGSRRAAMEARAKAINNERQRAKSPAPTSRHRRDKSTDGSHTPGRFPVVASPRPDGSSGRVVSMSAKRGSLEVPGSATSSPVTTRHQQQDSGSTGSNGSARAETLRADTVNSPDTYSQVTVSHAQNGTSEQATGQGTGSSSPEAPFATPFTEAIPDGEMPGAFMSSAPHMPPPADDDTVAASPVTQQADPKSATGSLRRTVGASGSGRRAPPSGRYGSLKARSNLNLTGQDGPTTQTPPGVQLQDQPMDDDFS